MKIDYLSGLEFLDYGFSYRGKDYRYDQIDSITFNATHTQHSISLIPAGNSYESNLELHLAGNAGTLRIQQQPAFWVKDQKLRMDAVWRAKEILSELTFSNRIRKYEGQFTTKGFFSYGRYQFHNDVNVFIDGKLLLSVTSNDITVSLLSSQICLAQRRDTFLTKLSGIFSADRVIDISRDRDCFLYMLRRAYNFYWPKEHYRTRREPPRIVFLKAVVERGAKMCSSDGVVGREELAAFRRHFQLNTDVFPDAASVFNDALRSAEGPEAIQAYPGRGDGQSRAA